MKKLNDLVREYLQNGDADAFHKYVGATKSSYFRWRKGENVTTGYHRVRAMYFLKKQGFPCEELLALPDQVRLLGELIAEGTVKAETAVKAVGLLNVHSMLDVLLGRKSCNFERLGKIDALVAKQSNVLEKGQEERDAVSKRFCELIGEAIPLLTQIRSTDFSDGERAMVRKKIGEFSLFNFSNDLDKLCGGKGLLQGQSEKF